MRNVPTGNVYLILKSAAAGGPGVTVINAVVAALALIVNKFRLVDRDATRDVLMRAVEMIRTDQTPSLEEAVDELQALVHQAFQELAPEAPEVD